MYARSIGVSAITFYQKKVSPRKGFCCAHAAHHGGWSCSEYGRRALQKSGYRKSIVLLWRRFHACHMAYQEEKSERRWRDLPGECIQSITPVDVGCCVLSLLLDL